MFPTDPTKIAITGMHVPVGAGYKCEDGTIVLSEDNNFSLAVLTPKGELVEPIVAGVTSKTPRTFVFNSALLSGATHINGTVVPANATVKVSTYSDPCDSWGEKLEANKIADVQTNEYGEFSISFSDREETVLFWCEVPSKFEAMNYGINLSISYERNDGDDSGDTDTGPYLIQTQLQCGSYNSGGGTGTPTFTMSGACPEDATQVYISAQPVSVPEGSDYVTELTNNTLYSAIPENGAYSVNFHTPIGYSNIVAWCISEIRNSVITASYGVDMGSINNVCLAGDTPILLFDGTYKALRDLTADDVLMAGDHTPTRITKIKRGIVSDYHTLYLFEDGTIIDEAHRHRFYNVDVGCWMYLDEWKIGDRAKNYDGSTPKLIRIERVDEPCRRYGLWTESHDYYAGNLLSGETAANQSVLANATLEQAADMMATLEADKLDKLYKGVLG